MTISSSLGTIGLSQFADLPNPLDDRNGGKIETIEEWENERRPEILELFRREMFGRAPVGRPESLAFEVVKEDSRAMDGTAIFREVEIRFSGPGGEGTIRLYLFLPKRQEPAPLFLLICHRDPENIDPTRTVREDFWPAEALVARGYGAAAFHVSDVDPDEDDGFRNGVHGILETGDEPRPPDAWGTLAAWAWGASRVMDYLETAPDIDAERVAVVGHSRGGKTALWAGARDERFALVVSNNSGANGAALARNADGAKIAFANKRFPHWFVKAYEKYGNAPNQLPFDQHWLIALSAPRHVYVASASKDDWADPEGEFLSCYYASPVWELYQLPGLAVETQPSVNVPVHAGRIAYHLREGKHDLSLQDWNWFMDYADKIWGVANR